MDTINDRSNFREVTGSLNTLQFTREEQDTLWRVIAAIVHLGNLEFQTDEDKLKIKNSKVADIAADLLQVILPYLNEVIYIYKMRKYFRCHVMN